LPDARGFTYNEVMSIHDEMASAVREVAQEIPDRFNGFEPWDVEERPQYIIEKAREHSIELDRGPSPFQSGYLFSKKFLTISQGGTQVGKSIPAWVDALIQASGKIPLSLRTPKGVDTGIKRNIEDKKLRTENIARWGRRDFAGNLLDYDVSVLPDGTWDCGTILGAGHYPVERIPHHPNKIWICTYKQAKEEYWWPNFKNWTPAYLLDDTKGVDGFSEAKGKVHFTTGSDITFITYEQGFARVEAKAVWHIILDEEPPDRQFYVAAMTHVEEEGGHLSMHFTPYNGISWSHDDIFQQVGVDPNIALFHATQYDCPYKTRESIETKAALMKAWEREARVFGHYSEQRGKPYYDRDKLNGWIRAFIPKGFEAGFRPTEAWDEPEELTNIDIEMEDKPSGMRWTVIEEPEPDVAYFLVCDTAPGTESPEEGKERGDFNGAFMLRLPKEEEAAPVICAYGKTEMKAIAFARECLYACAYYNNALLCPEAKGDSAGSFFAEATGWPHMFKMVVINDQTRKETAKDGFQTNARTRTELFDFVGDLIDHHAKNPGMNCLDLLRQAAQCVHGKKGRPDHPKRAHDDMLVPYGIGLWIWKNAADQVILHEHEPPERKARHPRGWVDNMGESRPILGSKRGLDEREKPRSLEVAGRFV